VRRKKAGFTLIELLVVMSIMAALLAIAAPRYFGSVDRAKEATLKVNLRLMREAIDKYRADTGKFPDTLNRLAEARYLRAVPVDPITERNDSWALQPHPDGQTPGVYDVRSAAAGLGLDGTAYAGW
jgi:general secretion pathway protein G